MEKRKPPRFWRLCRIYFRRFRISLWILALLILGCLIYLNQVGLPAFIKRPLLQRLRERGLELQFSRLRLRWYEGIVAENVRFGRAGDPLSPELHLREVQVLLNTRALTRFQLQVEKLVLHQGRLTWPFASTNGIAQTMLVDNIQTDLRFLSQDQWLLDNFKAQFVGATIRLSGTVTNASAVREWSFFHGQRTEPASANRWQNRLQKLATRLGQVRFSAPPELRLDLRGDARDLQSFSVVLVINTPGAETPWGNLAEGRFTGRVFPADTNGTLRAELSLQAADAQTPWASAHNLQLGLKLLALEGETNLVHGQIELSAVDARSRWATATNLVFFGSWIHAITNPIPISGTGTLVAEAPSSELGTARKLQFSAELSRPPPAELPPGDTSWGLWTNLQPYALRWSGDAVAFVSKNLEVEQISAAGSWQAPTLTLTNLQARLYGGHLLAVAKLDVITRLLQARLQSTFDPHQIEPVLTAAARYWLQQYSWDNAPKVSAQVELVLPAWTNRQPDWRAEVQPTLSLSGEFDIPGGAHKGIHVLSAQSHFAYSNLCWRLPDLRLVHPQGTVAAEHLANQRTKQFYWRLHSDLDLRVARHLLEPDAQRGFDLLTFANPPVIDCEIWGHSRAPELTGIKGRVTLTNFSFRGQPASWSSSAFSYTNRVLELVQPEVRNGSQVARADGLLADFRRQLLFLTNGFSTMPPMAIANAIGPKTAKTIAPYRFEKPPTARVHGVIPLHADEDADLHFDLAGAQFSWWRFHVPHIAARLHWKGLHLSLTNVLMDFYGGRAAGFANFDFPSGRPGTDFSFRLNATNVLLQTLMADLATRTNHLEGTLNAAVTVTRAQSESWNSVFGYGDLDLHDGLIWDIPLFGILTPILNGIAPGLGSSRAGAATCSFNITNGVIRTDDLEIRSPALRLQYRGTVDFDSRVNARVEAELLRDVWLIGPLVSTVLWPVTKLFEYKLTGTLSEPKTEPVYIIPKIVLMPFHPLRTLKSLLPPEPTPPTNSPPVFLNLPEPAPK